MNKPILYCSKLSPAVRGVLLTAKAMDLELDLRCVRLGLLLNYKKKTCTSNWNFCSYLTDQSTY